MLLRFPTKEFHEAVSAMSGVHHVLEMVENDGAAIDLEGTYKRALSSVSELLLGLDGLGLVASTKALKRLQVELGHGKRSGHIKSQLSTCYQVLFDELDGFPVLSLDPKVADYFTGSALFGDEVETVFPMASEDIAEAGKCLSVGRATATVFHLMRVMEKLLQRFGTLLGSTLSSDQNWQNILEQVDKKIKALPASDPKRTELSQAAANLYAVKLAWRNEVMHPKATYTEEEALNVYNSVRTFARELARIV